MAAEDRLKHKEPEPDASTPVEGSTATAVPINENLFLEEDLDGLDDEFNDLELEE